jgi:uncharacterized integral membrane protein
MRLIGIFITIIVMAIILWFFSLNLDQYVTVRIFSAVYEGVNLVTVIFLSVLSGIVIGALMVAAQVIKAKADVISIKKQNKSLIRELESLRNLSIDEIPEQEINTDLNI